jgi:hypothetical protein
LINRFYSVYLNLVLVGLDGRVFSVSGPDRFPTLVGKDLSGADWVRRALATKSGDAYVADEIRFDADHGSTVAVYATAVRQGGAVNGRPLGALGVYFDWKAQSRSIVCDEPNLTPDDWRMTRVLLLDQQRRVIAASDDVGLLEPMHLNHGGRQKGVYTDGDQLIAFARTIGYQEYDGLGWYAVIVRKVG